MMLICSLFKIIKIKYTMITAKSDNGKTSTCLITFFKKVNPKRIANVTDTSKWKNGTNPAAISLLKVNNGNTKTRCEIYSKLTIKTSERDNWRRSGAFIVNLEHISHLALVFLLLNLNMQSPAWKTISSTQPQRWYFWNESQWRWHNLVFNLYIGRL